MLINFYEEFWDQWIKISDIINGNTCMGLEISESTGLNLWLILSSVTGWLWWVAWQLLSTKFTHVQRQSKNFWVVFLLFTAAPNIQFLKSHHQEIKKIQAEAVLRCGWGNMRMFCERNGDFLLWPVGSVSEFSPIAPQLVGTQISNTS